MNMQALMKQAQQMQKEITSAQKEINEMEFSATSGVVTVTITGDKKVKSVKIIEDEVLKEDLSILEDMVLLAMNEAINKVDSKTQEKLGKYANMMPGMM